MEQANLLRNAKREISKSYEEGEMSSSSDRKWKKKSSKSKKWWHRSSSRSSEEGELKNSNQKHN